jgi:hypothetical protein
MCPVIARPAVSRLYLSSRRPEFRSGRDGVADVGKQALANERHAQACPVFREQARLPEEFRDGREPFRQRHIKPHPPLRAWRRSPSAQVMSASRGSDAYAQPIFSCRATRPSATAMLRGTYANAASMRRATICPSGSRPIPAIDPRSQAVGVLLAEECLGLEHIP